MKKTTSRLIKLSTRALAASTAIAVAVGFGIAQDNFAADSHRLFLNANQQLLLQNNNQILSRNTYGKYGGVNSAFLAVADFKESLIDMSYVTSKNGTQYAILLTGFAHGETKIDLSTAKQQKIRVFRFGIGVWRQISETNMSGSVSQFENTFIQTDEDMVIPDTNTHFFKENSTAAEQALTIRLNRNDTLPVNNFTNIFYDQENGNIVAYGLNGRTLVSNFDLNAASQTLTNLSGNLFDLNNIKLNSVNGNLANQLTKLRNDFTSNGARDYESSLLAVKGFQKINGKYYFTGEGEMVVVYDPSTNQVINANIDSLEGTSKISSELNNVNGWQTQKTNTYWNSRYFKQYSETLSFAINGVVEAANGDIVAFGGHSAIDNTSAGNRSLITRLNANGQPMGQPIELAREGAIIDGLFLNGRYIFATQIGIYTINQNLDPQSITSEANFKPFQTGYSRDGDDAFQRPYITKIIPNGKGGIFALTLTSQLQKSDISNVYSGSRFGVARPVFNNGILMSQDYKIHSQLHNLYTGKILTRGALSARTVTTKLKSTLESTVLNGENLPTQDNGNPLQFIKSGILTLNFDNTGTRLEVENASSTFGNETYKTQRQVPGFVNVPDAIVDIYPSGDGEIYTIHVDGSIRKLNSSGFSVGFSNTNGINDNAYATKQSFDARQAELRKFNVLKSYSDEKRQFALVKSQGNRTVYSLASFDNQNKLVKHSDITVYSNPSNIHILKVTDYFYIAYEKGQPNYTTIKFTNESDPTQVTTVNNALVSRQNIQALVVAPGISNSSNGAPMATFFAATGNSTTQWNPQVATLNLDIGRRMLVAPLEKTSFLNSTSFTGPIANNQFTEQSQLLDLVIDPILGNPVFIALPSNASGTNKQALRYTSYDNPFGKLSASQTNSPLMVSDLARSIGHPSTTIRNTFVSGNSASIGPQGHLVFRGHEVVQDANKFDTRNISSAITLQFNSQAQKDLPPVPGTKGVPYYSGLKNFTGDVNSLLVIRDNKIVRVQFGKTLLQNSFFTFGPITHIFSSAAGNALIRSNRTHQEVVLGDNGRNINQLNVSSVSAQTLTFDRDAQDNNFKFLIPNIKHAINDGFGGIYVASDRAVARLKFNEDTNTFEVLSTKSLEQTLSADNNFISSLEVDSQGLLIVNSTQGNTVLLNPLLSNGFIVPQVSNTSAPLYGPGISNRPLSQNELNSYQQLVNMGTSQFSLDGRTLASGSDPKVFKLQGNIANFPTNIEEALKGIRFSSGPIANGNAPLRINTDRFFSFDFKKLLPDGLLGSHRSDITSYYSDISLEFSYDGYRDGSNNQIWVGDSSQGSAAENFVNIINVATSSLNPTQAKAFFLDRIWVRVVKKGNGKNLFANNYSKIVVKTSENPAMLVRRPKQVVQLFNDDVRFNENQSFWRGIVADENSADRTIFRLVPKSSNAPLTNRNLRILLPRVIAETRYFNGPNAPLEVRFQTDGSAPLDQWKTTEELANLRITSGQSVFYRFFVKERFRSESTPGTTDLSPFSYVFENISGQVAKDPNVDYASVPIRFSNFAIPIDLGFEKAANYRFINFSGVPNPPLNSQEFSDFNFEFNNPSSAGHPPEDLGHTELIYYLSNRKLDLPNGQLSDNDGTFLFKNSLGISSFTKADLIQSLKDGSLRDPASQQSFGPNTYIYASSRLKASSAQNEFRVDTSISEIYSPQNGSRDDNSKVTIYVPSQEYKDLITNIGSATEINTAIKFNGTNNQAFKLDITGAPNFDFAVFSRSFKFQYSEDNTNFIDVTSLNQTFSSNTRQAFLKIVPLNERITTENANLASQEVQLNVKTVISDLNLNNLSALQISGNTRNIMIVEPDSLKTSRIPGLQTVADFERNVFIGYSIQGITPEPLNKDDFTKFLNDLSTERLNSIQKDQIKVTYVLTREGNNKFVRPDVSGQDFLNGVNAPVDNLKKYFSVKNIINSETIRNNLTLAGTDNDLNFTFSPGGPYDPLIASRDGYKFSFGYWSVTENQQERVATYNFTSQPPRNIYRGSLANFDRYVLNDPLHPNETIASANEASQYHILAVRISAVDPNNVVLGRETSDPSDPSDSFPTRFGQQIDHTRIVQEINVQNGNLHGTLSLNGTVTNFAGTQTREEFERQALAAIPVDLRDKVEILYTIGERIGAKEEFNFDEFKDALRNFDGGPQGPLLLRRPNSDPNDNRLKQVSARYALKADVDNTLFRLVTQNVALQDLNQDNLKVPVDLDILATALQSQPILVEGTSNTNITRIVIPPTSLGNLDNYLETLNNNYNITFEYNAPNGPNADQFFRDPSRVNSLGSPTQIRVRFAFPSQEEANYYEVSAANAPVDPVTGFVTITKNVRIPKLITVDRNVLSLLSIGGTTQRIEIPDSDLQNILNAIGTDQDKVQIQFAIGSSINALTPLNGNDFWYTKEEITQALLSFSAPIPLEAKRIFARYTLAPDTNPQDFLVSDPSPFEVTGAQVKAFLNIDDFISQLANRPLSFSDTATSANPGEPEPPFSDPNWRSILRASGVLLEYSQDRFTWSTRFPSNLGNPPQAFARFRAENPSNTAISSPETAGSATSRAIPLNFRNLKVQLDIETSNILNLVRFSGNTKNLVIDESQAIQSNPFAFGVGEITYSITNNINDPNSFVRLLPTRPSQRWFNKEEITILLNDFPEDLILRRSALGVVPNLKVQTYRIQMRFRIKSTENPDGFAFKDNTVQTFDANAIENVKSFVHTSRFVDLLNQNIPGKRITFGNSSSQSDIQAVNFDSLPISQDIRDALRDSGVILQFKANSETISGSNVFSWFDTITQPLSLVPTDSSPASARRLALRFSLDAANLDASRFFEIENTSTVVKRGEELVIPRIVTTDSNLLKNVIARGTTKNITINDQAAIDAVTGTDSDKVQIEYAIGSFQGSEDNLLQLQAGNQRVWFHKTEFITFLNEFPTNIRMRDFSIHARYAVSDPSLSDDVNVSDGAVQSVDMNALKLAIDLKNEPQNTPTGVISDLLTLPSLQSNFPNVQNNLDLGQWLNPFNADSLALLRDWGIILRFSLSQERTNPLEVPPAGVEGQPPLLYYWFATTAGSRVQLSDESSANQILNIPGPFIVSLDTSELASNFKFSGNTRDLNVDISSFGKNPDGTINAFIFDNLEPRFALNNESFGQGNSSDAEGFADRTYFRLDKFLELLRGFQEDIIGSQKVIHVRFFSKVTGTNSQFQIADSNGNNINEADLSQVLSFVHLEEQRATLINELSSANETDSDTNITGITLPLPLAEVNRLNTLGIIFQYSNAANVQTVNNVLQVPEDTWSTVPPQSLVPGRKILYFRFIINGSNTSDIFIDPAQLNPLIINVAVRRNISVATSNLTSIRPSGNTKDLLLENEEAALNAVAETDRNSVQIEYAIGDLGSEIALQPNKIWYTRSEFISALLAHPETIYHKTIQARYNVKPEEEQNARVSTTASAIIEGSGINSNARVKVFIRDDVSGIDVPSLVTISGISTNINVDDQALKDLLPQGLQVEYANVDDIQAQDSRWRINPPATISPQRKLYARIAPSEGYVFDDSVVIELNTGSVRDNVIVINRLNSINLSGTTKDLLIDDDFALGGISESVHRNSLTIKYSVGEAINGVLWFDKASFITTLKDLKGILPSGNIILREDIKARYDYVNPQSNGFVFTINGIQISESNINEPETEQFQLQLVANNSNTELKGFLNVQAFKDLNLNSLTLAGTDEDPSLIISDRILEFLRRYNGSNAFRINYTSTRLREGFEGGNFGTNLRLFPLINAGFYTNSINLNSVPANLLQPFRLDPNDVFFALRFTATSFYVLGEGDQEISDYEFSVPKDNINVLFGVNGTFLAQPQLALEGVNDPNVLEQGATTVNIANRLTDLDPNLDYFYYVTRTRIPNDAALQTIVNDNTLWTTNVPNNLKVGDFVYVKIDVKTPETHILTNPVNNVTRQPLVVSNLLISANNIQIDTNSIRFTSADASKNSPFDGASIISFLPLMENSAQQFGVDVIMETTLDYILDPGGNIQIDSNGIPIVRRSGSANTNRPILLRNGAQAKDENGNNLFYSFDENGNLGAPLSDPNKVVSVNLSTLNGTEDEFIFKQDNLANNLQRLLFQNQVVTFKFKLREGFRVDNQNALDNLAVTYVINGLRFEILNINNFQLNSLKGNYAPGRASDQEPINGFASFDNTALEGQVSLNGSLQTVSGFRELAEQLLNIDQSLRLQMQVIPAGNGVNPQPLILYPNGINGASNLPTNLSNDDVVEISVISTNESKAFNAKAATLAVQGLVTEAPVNGLRFLSIDFDGRFDGEGTFRLSTVEPGTSVNPLPKEYVFLYSVNGSEFTRETPNNLKNGDLITWKLTSTNSATILENDFANQIAISPDENGVPRFEVQRTPDGVDGFLVSGLKRRFEIPSDFDVSSLNNITFTYTGDNGVANHEINLNGVTVPDGLEIRVFNITQNRIIDGLGNDRLSNGDKLQIRLVLSQTSIDNGFILNATNLVSNITTVSGLVDSRQPVLNTQSSVFIAVGSVLGILAAGGIAYIITKRRRLK